MRKDSVVKCGRASWAIIGQCRSLTQGKKANIMSVNISSSQRDPKPRLSHVAERTRELRLGGITPFTTIDFPGRLAAVLYTQGCAWRCRYCYNAHLQPFTQTPRAEAGFE